MPGPRRTATGHLFLISAAVAVAGLIATVFLEPAPLRSSLDLPAPADHDQAAQVRAPQD